MLIPFLIGFAVGAGMALTSIFTGFKVKTKEQWEEYEAQRLSWRTCLDKVTAENANLRVALAAGEMTEDGKKVAAMTMAALETIIAAEKVK